MHNLTELLERYAHAILNLATNPCDENSHEREEVEAAILALFPSPAPVSPSLEEAAEAWAAKATHEVAKFDNVVDLSAIFRGAKMAYLAGAATLSNNQWVAFTDTPEGNFPKSGKLLLFTDGKSRYRGFWCCPNHISVEFEDMDDNLPDYVDTDLQSGDVFLKEGWYYEQHEHDDMNYYYPVPNVTHYCDLPSLPTPPIQ